MTPEGSTDVALCSGHRGPISRPYSLVESLCLVLFQSH